MNFLRRIRAAWHPDEYHGWGKTQRYFEGWYYKLVSADERHALAFIPGISMSESGEKHAFVQVMDGKACKAYYHRFEANDFKPSERNFEVSVGNSFFSDKQITIDLPDIQGAIQFQDSVSWPKMLGAPGIMGWYSFVPFMECNHGVVSLDHHLKGSIQMNGNLIDFSGGKGYIEKDWGQSFPRAYVWMQSNHFNTSDKASLLASVAHIPWMGSYFIGFISGFLLGERLFRFATYTGAKKHLELGKDNLTLIFKNPKTELRIFASQAAGTTLISPISGEMTGKINESLQANLLVELWENKQRIFEGNGRNAGLEVAGEVDSLLTESAKLH